MPAVQRADGPMDTEKRRRRQTQASTYMHTHTKKKIRRDTEIGTDSCVSVGFSMFHGTEQVESPVEQCDLKGDDTMISGIPTSQTITLSSWTFGS